ncbi:nuclear transport factor 2 family protein [Glaciibacter sp. 2TAF33]|uniref:nuclear transport factor 2 family protein n=1 Tax=Glaciibacter sp. 2TAF33 TaxID=3233015 RepID=UPI003F9110C0
MTENEEPKMTDQYSLSRAADRFEIQNKLYLICRAIDRRDLESARTAFHPDAVDHHGAYQGDIDGFMQWVEDRHGDLEYSWHELGNIYIEFASDDEAFSESYVLTWQTVTPGTGLLGGPDKKHEVLAAGRYVDHWSRRDGQWRIQRRQTLPERSFVVPESTRASIPRAPQFLPWTRDANDPAERMLLDLGLRGPAVPR